MFHVRVLDDDESGAPLPAAPTDHKQILASTHQQHQAEMEPDTTQILIQNMIQFNSTSLSILIIYQVLYSKIINK